MGHEANSANFKGLGTVQTTFSDYTAIYTKNQ